MAAIGIGSPVSRTNSATRNSNTVITKRRTTPRSTTSLYAASTSHSCTMITRILPAFGAEASSPPRAPARSGPADSTHDHRVDDAGRDVDQPAQHRRQRRVPAGPQPRRRARDRAASRAPATAGRCGSAWSMRRCHARRGRAARFADRCTPTAGSKPTIRAPRCARAIRASERSKPMRSYPVSRRRRTTGACNARRSVSRRTARRRSSRRAGRDRRAQVARERRCRRTA